MEKANRTEISSTDFIKILNEEELPKSKQSKYNKVISLDTNSLIRINGAEIKDKIVIENIDNLKSLRFSNSIINSLVIKCNLKGNIEIKDDTVINQLIITNNCSVRYVGTDNCVIKRFDIFEGQCDVIAINNSRISTILIKGEQSNGGDINIANSEVTWLYIEESSKCKSITIDESKISTFKIYDKVKIDYLEMTNNSICLNLKLNSIDISEFVQIKNSKIKSFSLKTFSLPELLIQESFIETLEYKNNIPTTFNLKKCEVVNFCMTEMRTGKDGLIQIIDCWVNNLKFETILNLASFNISKLKPLRDGFKFAESKYEIVPIRYEEATLSFINSDLGKMMISSDLSKFDRLYFLNSKIVDVFIAGAKLPKIFTLDGEDSITQQKIAFNQIKKIYENRGDSVSPLIYRKYEMEAYRKEIDDEVEKKRNDEKFQLNFNYFSNRHGTSWSIPLGLTIGISSFLYIVYCIILFGFGLNGDWLLSVKLIPFYFEFINPMHKSNFLIDFNFESISLREGFAIFVDFISRIIIPLLIYQMVQAFRKYGKK